MVDTIIGRYGRMFIDSNPDVEENEGGYYCKAYADEDMSIELDDFCIHKEELELIPSEDFWKMAYACGCYYTVLDALRSEYKYSNSLPLVDANSERTYGIFRFNYDYDTFTEFYNKARKMAQPDIEAWGDDIAQVMYHLDAMGVEYKYESFDDSEYSGIDGCLYI